MKIMIKYIYCQYLLLVNNFFNKKIDKKINNL